MNRSPRNHPDYGKERDVDGFVLCPICSGSTRIGVTSLEHSETECIEVLLRHKAEDAQKLALATTTAEIALKDVAEMTARAEKAEAELAAAKMKHQAMADEYGKDLARLQTARLHLATVLAHGDDVWFWQGKGDHPESLVCPVVMSAATLRDLLARAERPTLEGPR